MTLGWLSLASSKMDFMFAGVTVLPTSNTLPQPVLAIFSIMKVLPVPGPPCKRAAHDLGAVCMKFRSNLLRNLFSFFKAWSIPAMSTTSRRCVSPFCCVLVSLLSLPIFTVELSLNLPILVGLPLIDTTLKVRLLPLREMLNVIPGNNSWASPENC